MKIYKITIGTHTAKGKFQEHAQILVKSDLDIKKVQSHFYEQYKGLSMNVVEITENVIEIKEEKKKKTVKISDFDIETSEVTANYKKNSEYSEHPTLQNYTAIVSSSDLPRWKEFAEKRRSLEKQIDELKANYEGFVKENFAEIKSFERFEIQQSGVKFEFKPSGFDLKLVAQIDTNIPVEELPF